MLQQSLFLTAADVLRSATERTRRISDDGLMCRSTSQLDDDCDYGYDYADADSHSSGRPAVRERLMLKLATHKLQTVE